jgi:hypothetical protein
VWGKRVGNGKSSFPHISRRSRYSAGRRKLGSAILGSSIHAQVHQAPQPAAVRDQSFNVERVERKRGEVEVEWLRSGTAHAESSYGHLIFRWRDTGSEDIRPQFRCRNCDLSPTTDKRDRPRVSHRMAGIALPPNRSKYLDEGRRISRAGARVEVYWAGRWCLRNGGAWRGRLKAGHLLFAATGISCCGVNCRSEAGIHTWSFTALLC